MVVNLATGLNPDKFERSICCIGPKGDLADLAENKGVQVFSLEKADGFQWRLIFRLRKLLKRQKVHVLHSHNAGFLLYGAPAARLARKVVMVHTEHGRLLHEFDNERMNSIERFLSRWTDAMVAVSEPTRETYVDLTGLDPDRIKVVGNGVDIGRFQIPADARLRESLGIQPADHVIGNIARLSIEKDHAGLIEAFSRMLDWSKNLKLLLVGDGEERQNLEALVKKLRIDHKVIFTGIRRDIPALVAIMDIFCLSSRTEGMPLTLLEAMAAGKGIVCTEVGGIPNIIRSGYNGFLVPPEKPEKLAEALFTLVQDRNLAGRMRNAARKDAEKFYSLEKMIQSYENIYLEHYHRKFHR
jgi:glycosyltransferase involved in cell wall biosynthesis